MRYANTPQEDKKILSFQRKAVTAFKRLIKELRSYGAQAKSQHKGRGKVVLNKRKRHIVKSIKNLPEINSFLNTYVGTDEVSDKAYSWRNTTIYLIRDYLAGAKNLREVSSSFESNSVRHFKALELHKKQRNVRDSIPVELRAFLPDTIVVDVDEDGNIKKINDMFGNKTYTLSEKIKVQNKLIRKYNTIVKKVQKDLKSRDEMIRLSAVITSVIMETGIRPGKIGNGCLEIVDGKKVPIETFGAITLNTSHVEFVRENFAELKFKGKMGTVNTASISDKNIIKILKDYVKNALDKGSDYIFVNEEGVQYNYSDLVDYFRTNFRGFKITDFRKLRATQVVFDGLKEERDEMLRQIKLIAEEETEELTQKVVSIIAETINKAHERAQVALSHDKSTTTKKSYINPQVLLRFLSTSSVQHTLKDCITSGKTKLKFDPMVFVREAKKVASSRVILSSGRSLETLESLIDILRHIFDEDGNM